MLIAFVVIFLLSSFWIKAIAVDQQMGYNPFLFGTDLFCIITRLILLVMCIWYLGWIAGIIVSVLDFFGIISACFSWFLNLPFLAYKNIEEMHKKMRFKLSMLPVVLIVCLVFTIVSFFTTRFASLFDFFVKNIFMLVLLVVIAIISNIIRVIVLKKFYTNDAAIEEEYANTKSTPQKNTHRSYYQSEEKTNLSDDSEDSYLDPNYSCNERINCIFEADEMLSANDSEHNAEPENQMPDIKPIIRDLFADYFDMFIYSPQLSSNSLRKPITAAYLFVIFDYIAMANEKRELSYEIISTIEDELLSGDELYCYDKCVNLFGAIVRKQISPRGDWLFYKSEETIWLRLLYLCYGDLIRYPNYISEYETHPIILEDPMKLMDYANKFERSVWSFTQEFAEVFTEKLK